MAKIRADLVGVTYAHQPDGAWIVLSAGDDVPSGITVGDHLIDDQVGTAAPSESAVPSPAPTSGDDVPKPRGNAGRDAWAKYATSKGYEFDQDATRDEIKAAVEAAEG